MRLSASLAAALAAVAFAVAFAAPAAARRLSLHDRLARPGRFPWDDALEAAVDGADTGTLHDELDVSDTVGAAFEYRRGAVILEDATLLHAAAAGGRGAAVAGLLRAGADPNAACGFMPAARDGFEFRGVTALHIAALTGSEGAARALVAHDGTDVSARAEPNTYTPLCFAADRGHAALVRLLLDAGARDVQGDASATHFAAMQGHNDVLRMLLDAGSDVNSRGYNGDGDTPLHAAAQAGNAAGVRILLDAGADPAITPLDGMRAIDVALESGNDDIADILLEAGSPAAGTGAPAAAGPIKVEEAAKDDL